MRVVCQKMMTHYFQQDSEVCIWWTLYYLLRPRERICDADAGESRGSDNMVDEEHANFHIRT